MYCCWFLFIQSSASVLLILNLHKATSKMKQPCISAPVNFTIQLIIHPLYYFWGIESLLYFFFCELCWDLTTYLPFTLMGLTQINCPQQQKFCPSVSSQAFNYNTENQTHPAVMKDVCLGIQHKEWKISKSGYLAGTGKKKCYFINGRQDRWN